MEIYKSFSVVYDDFMDNVPYETWGKHIREILLEYGIKDGLILDLGCGTGTMTEILAGYGYDMIGLDNSVEMLEIAREKQIKSSLDILYLQQDMSSFELYGTVRAIVCLCDSLNYITRIEDLAKMFHWVDFYLDPKGLFIFDFNTAYKYKYVLGNQIIAENRVDKSFIWENYYHEKEKINEIELTLFIAETHERQGLLFRKHEEVHYQRAYEWMEIKTLLEEKGLEAQGVFDGYSKKKATSKSERVLGIAREQKKE
ncbi:MAG: class I SAM-dependent methyltransferase [Lachnospiraceae bacterium]|nr:class I SAM-dependent methyltransferase [Lachnospiraceae bacterium]